MGAARLSEVSVGPLFWRGGALIYGGDIADFGGLTLMETPPPTHTHTHRAGETGLVKMKTTQILHV